MRKTAFCVVDAGYIDPAIVAINSFLKFNRNIPLIVFAEIGTNIQRIADATGNNPQVTILTREFPRVECETFGQHNPLLEFFISRAALPAFAMRIKALEELRETADIIINFDMDVIFLNTIEKLASSATRDEILGVSERENRSRWVKSLNVKDIVNTHNYINSGFVIYGADAAEKLTLEEYSAFLNRFPDDIYCPEQDFINFQCTEKIRLINDAYNLMFTSPEYKTTAPVMIHYYGRVKPWSVEGIPAGVGHYFRRYLIEAEKNQSYVSSQFLEKIKNNVSKLEFWGTSK